VKFQILGPFEVRSGERSLVVPRAKQRALLLALLLRPNEVVSTDRLIDAVWGEHPPATAMTALQGHVSQLRKLLPPDRLLTRAPGYVLRVEPGELDIDRLEALRQKARAALDDRRPEDAVVELREALALWRGPPLADIAYLPFAEAEIARLEELLAETIEERIHAELALGLDAELIGELEGLVRVEPFRERRRAQLMLALYRAGRQADALQVYQEGRRRLVEELGIAPGPALQELQQQILAQDPALRPPARREAVRELPRQSRRTVTVLAIGSVFAMTDPEALRNASDRALEAIRLTATRHGGVIERELGDLCVCVFGAAAVQEDAALRAVRAAAELRSALQIRAGVATGEVVVGESGVIGIPVAHAQRLQLVAAAGEIRIDRPSWRLVRDAIEAEPADDAFRVLGVDDSRAGVARYLDSPLVGRSDELELLLSVFERAVATRTPQIVTLLGPAGIGKARLAAELAARAAGRAAVLRGRCLSYGEGITFWPVCELVRDAVGATQKDPADVVAAKLEQLLGPGADAAQLAGLLGVGEPAASGAELFHAVRALLELLAQKQPLVVVLDDLEHAEPALLDLVEYVVDLSRDVPLLVLCLARPELLEQRPGWTGARSHAAAILLDSLSADEGEALIQNLLGGELLAVPVAERFVAAAGGNPLFLEQFLSMLIDDGLLQRDGSGRWVTADSLADVPVPHSVQLLVAARLDRLSPAELIVVECAAVEGTVFHRESIRVAVEERQPGLDIDAALRTLVAKELVRPTTASDTGDEAYRFVHVLIRDVAYAGMPKESRGRIHELFARWIESTAGDRILEIEEVLGHHLEQAYQLRADVGVPDETLARNAAERLERAGRRAHARGDFRSAAGLLARADDLYVAAGDRQLELLHARGASLRLAGAFADARSVLEEGLEAATALADRRLEAHLLLELCSLRLMADPTVSLAEVAAIAERSLRVFAEPDDDCGLAHANSLLGDVNLYGCRFGEMEKLYERALVHARRAGDEQGCARAHRRLAQAAFLGPRPVESGIARCEQIRDEADADPSARAHAWAVLGVLDAMRGRFDQGRAWISECRALCDEFGLERAIGWVPGFAGCVELVAGDAAAAADELQRGYAALRSTGETAVLATTAALLAQALERQGCLDEAEALMVESEGTVGTGDLVSQIYWRQVRARVRSGRGDRVVAERLAREAVALAEKSDMLAVHGAALVDLASVVDRKSSERSRAFELAIELFERKGDIVDAGRARSALNA
jgi:DNA-binding SARP family transcriptional activator